MFDLLVYVFENYLSSQHNVSDLSKMTTELEEAGFEYKEIEFAIDWFATLKVLSEKINDKKINESGLKSRIYSKREYEKINKEGICFLIFLEKATILSPAEREIIIDRAMAVDQTDVNLDELKWIVMMTLWHFGRENEYLFVEDALFNPKNGAVH